MSIGEYIERPAECGNALVSWSYRAFTTTISRIPPDGCRDVIVSVDGDHDKHCHTTTIQTATLEVPSEAGTHVQGIRLKPGTVLNTQDMARWLANNSIDDLLSGDQLDEFCSRQSSVDEALDCLGSYQTSVSKIALTLGVSTRTLQRHVMHATGRTPAFWISLSRARRAACLVSDSVSITDIALQNHYADQSHMTREFKRWFSCTPHQLRHDIELMTAIRQQGYGG